MKKFVKPNSRFPEQQPKPGRNKSLPPYIFVHEVANGWQTCTLHEKIAELVAFDARFENHLLFNVSLTSGTANALPLQIEYDKLEKTSYYKLEEDKEYVLNMAMFNTSPDHSSYDNFSIKLEYDADYFFITNPERIAIGADADNRHYKLLTTDIKSRKTADYIKLQSIAKNGTTEEVKYEQLIKIEIHRSKNKLTYFMIIAAALLATAISSPLAVNAFKDGNITPGILFSLIALVGAAAAAGMQFHIFNKRT